MEQKPEYKTGGRERGRTLPPPRSFTHPILRVVFDSRSLFLAQKLHQNACYVGYPPYKLFFLFKQLRGITRASFQASKASRTEALMTAVEVFVIIAALSDEEE